MRTKYILQLKRRYFWEDTLVFYDKKEALNYELRLIAQSINCRIVEVVYI